MIKSFTAWTEEVDDPALAAREILDMLQPKENLLKNSVGIISCHYEHVFSGAVKAVCRALPFPVAGTVTTSQAVGGRGGLTQLSLMVLTSDELVFETALTPSLLGDPSAAIEETYLKAAAKHSSAPSLILSFASFMLQNSGDEYVNTITRVSGGVPCFGTLAVDDSSSFENSFSILNGDHYRDCMAMILIFGDISPKFYIATISKEKIIDRPAKITSSSGHVLKEVDGKPILRYFEEMGLREASEVAYAMTSVPMMLDYNDGTPMVSKVFIALNEQGEAICAGAMPEASYLYLGVFDKEDVLLTTGKAVKKALEENPNAAGMLIYSCVSRSLSLMGDLAAETDLVDSLTGGLPFMMVYSGGEMCPTALGGANGAVNRFHNNSFILCTF